MKTNRGSQPEFNLFLLFACLIAIPIYLAGAAILLFIPESRTPIHLPRLAARGRKPFLPEEDCKKGEDISKGIFPDAAGWRHRRLDLLDPFLRR